MKNITISVDDETYRRARMWAADRDTSVSAIVRCILTTLPARSQPRRGRSAQPGEEPEACPGSDDSGDADARPGEVVPIPGWGISVLRMTLAHLKFAAHPPPP
jgi:hypothetical protein